jgi:CRP-like cAMP-binding protein
VGEQAARVERLVSKFDHVNGSGPPHVPNAKTRAAIRELDRGAGQRFKDVPALMADLNSADLSKGQIAILQQVVRHGEVSKGALITLTGYRKSTRNRLLHELRALQCITERGSFVYPTDEGRRRCPMEDLPTGDKLMQWWLERLSDGQAVMLRAVAAAYPNAITREEAGGTVNYAKSTCNRLLHELQASQLVTVPSRGLVRASEKLFD